MKLRKINGLLLSLLSFVNILAFPALSVAENFTESDFQRQQDIATLDAQLKTAVSGLVKSVRKQKDEDSARATFKNGLLAARKNIESFKGEFLANTTDADKSFSDLLDRINQYIDYSDNPNNDPLDLVIGFQNDTEHAGIGSILLVFYGVGLAAILGYVIVLMFVPG